MSVCTQKARKITKYKRNILTYCKSSLPPRLFNHNYLTRYFKSLVQD